MKMIRRTKSPISLFILQLILELLIEKSALRLTKHKVVENHGEGGHDKPQAFHREPEVTRAMLPEQQRGLIPSECSSFLTCAGMRERTLQGSLTWLSRSYYMGKKVACGFWLRLCDSLGLRLCNKYPDIEAPDLMVFLWKWKCWAPGPEPVTQGLHGIWYPCPRVAREW